MASIDTTQDDLASVRQQDDFSQIPPINMKRMLTCVNNFLITSVTCLNSFSHVLEEELHENTKVLDRMESELLLLEQKVCSAPIKTYVPKEPETKPESSDTKPTAVEATNTTTETEAKEDKNSEVVQEQSGESEGKTEAPNPELARFLKMVQFGVPVPAVKLKMQQEGFDPDLLNA